jgi:DNA-binding response OmpR family regulator
MLRPSPKIPRILLLEDEPAVRHLLAESLARCGYAVLAGGSLEDGLSVLASPGRERIDLVVTDSHLGRDPAERNGHLLHARWRALHPVPPFIFLCGWGEADPPPETCCQVYGLAKPFPFPALLTLVRAVVGP